MSSLLSKYRIKLEKLKRKWRYSRLLRHQPTDLLPSENETIDVVIPVVEKDLDILGHCIQGIRQCVANKIGQIYLVGAENERLRTAAGKLDAILIDETTILGYGPGDLHIVTTDGRNRSGWMFQQLLKLSGKIGNNRFFLVIDADHILLQPHVFVDRLGRSVMYMGREYNEPYYMWMTRVMGLDCNGGLSYVAHKMIFDRDRLSELRAEIERHGNGESWDKVILDTLDRSTQSGFSEYETYGHWLDDKYKVRLPWLQKSFRKADDGGIPPYKELVGKYGAKYRSITFPDYKVTKKNDKKKI